MRPILDLEGLNSHLKGYKFKMLTCDTLLRNVRKGDWFTSRDVRDTEDRLYQYAVLPS